MKIGWPQALSWRLGRQWLEPPGAASVADVVQRLGAVPAMDDQLAALAIGARRRAPQPDDLADAVRAGRVVAAYAFRGATHYLSAADGGAYLALRASGRMWERRSWQDYYQLAPDDWPDFRAAVRDALADGPLTIAELGAVLTRPYRQLEPVFAKDPHTLMKPLMWQGDMSFGPRRDGSITFQRLDGPHWKGIWELDEAGPHAIRAYLDAYGPASAEHVHYWLGNGLGAGRNQLNRWLDQLAPELTIVSVDGESCYMRAADEDALAAARPSRAVHLLPGHDQWVLGPGTKDEHVVPPELRAAVTRKANLVIGGGVVRGTWTLEKDVVTVDWLGTGRRPRQALAAAVARLAEVSGRPRELADSEA